VVLGRTEIGEDGIRRCWWGASAPDYIVYHDTEWGFPVDDDHLLFEKLCLEGFQSGLSWLTILRKRPAFREVFAGFDYEVVAGYDERDVERLLGDARIIRHRGKIESTLNNARRAVDLADESGSLGAFFWRYEPPSAAVELVAVTEESKAMARDLKRRGFTYVGPTTAYAFMQAMGIVNDHVEECDTQAHAEQTRVRFRRPT
jgi:DNA-3-methyladenine glycosylase I